MHPSSDTPVYNLKAVVRETGLKPDTIRAWERRYGLPDPRRTESGHRLYSQNDIQMLKWLVARQNEGMNISRATVLWQRLQELQIDPADPAALHALPLPAELPPVSQPMAAMDTVAQLRDSWVNACLHYDEQGAERIISQAFALFSVEVVCIDLIQRGLAAIGEGWYLGRVTVQQEHFASALATRRLEALLASLPPPTRSSRILLGCPPLETHTFAPMLLALLLRRRGWDILFLGADIPLEDLIATTRAARPQLVILVAQQLHTAATLLEMGQLLLNERICLAFGGRIFVHSPELRQRIPGYYLGDQIDHAPQTVESVLAMPHPQPALTWPTDEYHDALRLFKAHVAQIEAEVWRRVGTSGILHEHLERANANMSRSLAAALLLGDLDFLRPQLFWIADLLSNHFELSHALLRTYLQAYAAATSEQLGNRGRLIALWLHEAAQTDFTSDPHLAHRAMFAPNEARARQKAS